jgi:hypothetical protein
LESQNQTEIPDNNLNEKAESSQEDSAFAECAPNLSVVIATTQPWPQLRGVLDSVYLQTRALGAELIIVDGHGEGLCDDHGYEGVRWLRRPGRTVFQLRAIGLAEARGEIVAVTEDHCRVAPDWCKQVLHAHQENPQAAMIGGVVENGAVDSPWDRAGFFISGGAFLPPIPNGERPNIAGQANISYKRCALPENLPPHGIVENDYTRDLCGSGRILINDDGLVVVHILPLGALGNCLIHYHDGRTSAGFARAKLGRAQRVFHVLCALLTPLRVAKDSSRIVARMVVRKPAYRWQALMSWPLMVVILHFHAAGELMGNLYGPGNSPHRMR